MQRRSQRRLRKSTCLMLEWHAGDVEPACAAWPRDFHAYIDWTCPFWESIIYQYRPVTSTGRWYDFLAMLLFLREVLTDEVSETERANRQRPVQQNNLNGTRLPSGASCIIHARHLRLKSFCSVDVDTDILREVCTCPLDPVRLSR